MIVEVSETMMIGPRCGWATAWSTPTASPGSTTTWAGRSWRWRTWTGPCTCWATSRRTTATTSLGNKTVNMVIGELPAAGVREWIQDRRHEEGLWSGGLYAAELQNCRGIREQPSLIFSRYKDPSCRLWQSAQVIQFNSHWYWNQYQPLIFIRSRAQDGPPSCYPDPAGQPENCFKVPDADTIVIIGMRLL